MSLFAATAVIIVPIVEIVLLELAKVFGYSFNTGDLLTCDGNLLCSFSVEPVCLWTVSTRW